MELDELDLKIVGLLKEDGRGTNHELAERLSVSEGTIRNRIKKLADGGFLAIRGMTNPELIHDRRVVFLGMKVAMSKDLAVTAEAVSKLPNVSAVSVVTGRYDIIAEIFIEPYKIIEFLSKDLAGLSSIVSTESFVALKNYNKWI